MNQITLQFDKRAYKAIHELMDHYNIKSRAELISKAISVLKIAAYVDKTKGELLARRGNHETKLLIR